MDADFRLNGQVNLRMRFLIIDDSVTMRRIIANILARLGYPEVVHASNGREALDRLAAETVDVVITDWYMPEMNGLDFVKTLRNSPATSHIPIMIVTANAASDDIQHALQLGVRGYILKPFTVETMKDKIDVLMAQIEPGPEPVASDAAADDETRVESGSPADAPPTVEPEPQVEPEPDFDTPLDLADEPLRDVPVGPTPELASDGVQTAEPQAGATA
jgi:two-component system chemotaxis response regulator CheY